MSMRRGGRPGLLGTMARTAVVAGTANATVNAMNRGQQQRDRERQAFAQQQAQPAPPAPTPAAPPAAPAPGPGPQDDLVGRLQQLGQLRQDGLLSDEEFAAATAKLLG